MGPMVIDVWQSNHVFLHLKQICHFPFYLGCFHRSIGPTRKCQAWQPDQRGGRRLRVDEPRCSAYRMTSLGDSTHLLSEKDVMGVGNRLVIQANLLNPD